MVIMPHRTSVVFFTFLMMMMMMMMITIFIKDANFTRSDLQKRPLHVKGRDPSEEGRGRGIKGPLL